MKRLFITAAAIFLSTVMFSQNKLVVYPAPKEAKLNKDFSVRVRTTETDWMNVDIYEMLVDKTTETVHERVATSVASFDFEGEVEIEVTDNRAKIEKARIRPLSYSISHTTDNNKLTFKLDKPSNLSIETNGEIFRNLQLFANPIDKNKPKKTKAKNLIYFAPGFHRLDEKGLKVPSGTTVYIAGGAVIDGQILVNDVENVNIYGRGIVYPYRKQGIMIGRSKNINIDGITTTQLPTGGSDNVRITNVKVISSYGWGDGLNVFASNNVSYDRVFCRNSDDCTTVYATRMGFKGGCKNIKMENSTLWADVAHPIFIGLHGNDEGNDTIQNLTYRNIDILDEHEQQIDYQGCLAISAGDNNTIKDVTFDNIRIEDIRKGQIVNLRICFNKKYCKAPGNTIDNVLFRNISYNGNKAGLSLIYGYNEQHKIKNITFEGLKVNGEEIYDSMPSKPQWWKTSDKCNFLIGEHVENIVFKKGEN